MKINLKQEYTGILLCGGKSSRLGHDKGLLLYNGITLAERALSVLSLFCGTLLISTGNEDYRRFGIELVPDIKPGNGPMMGIYSCLKRSTTNHHLVLAVDNIFVGQDYFEYVIRNSKDCHAAIPFIGDAFYEPLAGYYSKNILITMEELINLGNYKLPDLFNRIDVKKLTVEKDFDGYFPEYFKSINTPDDLLLLENKL